MAPTLRARKPPPAPAPTPAPAAVKKTKTAAASTRTKSTPSRGRAVDKAAEASKRATKAKTTTRTPARTKTKAAPKDKASVKPKGTTTGAKTNPAPAAVLDHRSYPHIFDAIISYAPYASLLALRGASHTLRKRVDLRLADHVIVHVGNPPPKNAKWRRLAPSFPPGPPKVRARQYRVAMSSFDGSLPGWICDYGHVTDNTQDMCGEAGGQCSQLRARWEAAFARTRVVDVHPFINSTQRMWRPKEALTGLEVVRFYPSGYLPCPIIAPTLVVFTTFYDKLQWEITSPAPIGSYDTKVVEHLIVHAEYDVARPTLPNCWVSLPTFREALRDIVLLFKPAAGTAAEANPEWREHRQHGFLWDVANSLRVGATNRFVLVGMHDMPQELVGLMDNKVRTRAELEADILGGFISWIREHHAYFGQSGDSLTEEREAQIRELVTFRSFDEYRQDVGEEQYRLATVQTYF